jgi:hypothetical protein
MVVCHRTLHGAGVRGRQSRALAAGAVTVALLVVEDELLNGNDLFSVAKALELHQLRLDLID